MRQGENSGTITHELGHFAFRLPDLDDNPYVKPYRRYGSAALAPESSRQIPVYAIPAAGSPASAKVTLKAVSESDPTKSATATVSNAKR